MVTKRGKELARSVEPIIGRSAAIELALSRMARLAVGYSRMQETWCSVELSERETVRLEASEARLEAAIRRHFDTLPAGLELRFTGDPRGYCVKLRAAPGDTARRGKLRGTDWGGEDVGVG